MVGWMMLAMFVMASTPCGVELPRTAVATPERSLLQDPAPDKPSRFYQKLAAIRADADKSYDAIWLGDSITHFWEEKWTGGPAMFKEYFGKYRVMNLGFGGIKVENVLWNIEKGGLLDGLGPVRIVQLMVGTNNLWDDSVGDIAAGVRACVDAVRVKLPGAKVVLLSVLPREVAHNRGGHDYRRKEANVDEIMSKITALNERLASFADGERVVWVDLTKDFLDADGLLNLDLFCDGTHPNWKGYRVIAKRVLPLYDDLPNGTSFSDVL